MRGGEVNKLPPGGPGRAKANDPISSLNEAWFHTLDRCVVNFPLGDVILPLMRNCFSRARPTPFSYCKGVAVISWCATSLALAMKHHSRFRPSHLTLAWRAHWRP